MGNMMVIYNKIYQYGDGYIYNDGNISGYSHYASYPVLMDKILPNMGIGIGYKGFSWENDRCILYI